MFGYILQQYLKKEYFQLCRYFWGRIGVDFYKDTDVLFEGNELDFELIKLFEETAHLKQFLTWWFNKTLHE